MGFSRGRIAFSSNVVSLILVANSLVSVRCVNIFANYNTNRDLTASEDMSECTWCVKQGVKEIAARAKSAMESGDEEVELRVRLDKKQVELLEEFALRDDAWIRLEEVLRLLNPSVVSSQSSQIPQPSPPQTLSPWVIIVMSTGGVTVCAMWMILSRQSVCLVAVLLFLLCFSAGLTWNWWKIYNEEYSKRVTQLPDECKPEENSWYHSVKGFLVDPECSEYFKAPVDDPVAMVSPHEVITQTVSTILIAPVSMAASSFSAFIHSLSDNLMWPLNWIVQILLTVFLLAAGTVVAITVLAGLFNLDMKFSTCLVSGELRPSMTAPAKKRPAHLNLSDGRAADKPRRKRPTDLALFPSPPSPFR